MVNDIKCQSLFAFKSDFIKKLFVGFSYPWEILPHIKEIISALVSNLPEGYELLRDGVALGKNVYIDPSARIDAPVIIGDNCEIRHGAFIRGSVILGNGCVIGNSSEIKNSILMDRSQIPHFNYVGDSIIGEGAHLGAGAICSNLRSDKKSVVIKGESYSLDTGLRKLGAILGDGVEVGCGAVLCPGTLIGKNSTVYPLAMTRGVYPECCIIKNTGITFKH